MSRAYEIAGFALMLAAVGFGVRAAAAYREAQGQVWLDYERAQQPPRTSGSPDINVGGLFDWFRQLGGGAGGQNPVNPPSGGGGVVSPPSPTSPPITFPSPAPSQYTHDHLTLARTIYGEAASESRRGKEAVANVVMNRVRSSRWPGSVAGVCLQPWQFSCWNQNDPMRARIENRQPGSNSTFDLCLAIARDATAGRLRDHTSGATHYYANYIAVPSWVRKSPNAVMTVQIGVHKFYRGIA